MKHQGMQVLDNNGAPKTGILKNGLITLWKVTPSVARNSIEKFSEHTKLSETTCKCSYLLLKK